MLRVNSRVQKLKAQKESNQNPYQGMFNGKNFHDLNGGAEVKGEFITDEIRERDRQIRLMGAGSNFWEGSYGNASEVRKMFKKQDEDFEERLEAQGYWY